MKTSDGANWLDRHHLGCLNLIIYVLAWHSRQETEELAACRPVKIDELTPWWPRPWLFSRVLLLFALAFAMLYSCWHIEGGDGESTLLPGLMIVGCLAFPFSMLMFFFELNKFRSVSLLRVLYYFFMGSCMSVTITFVLTTCISLLPYALPLGGLFEELGKSIMIFYFLMHYRRRPNILQGLLIGAAVGAGFSVFESAGYAFNESGTLLASILMRNIVSPACHTAWGAIMGGGLMMMTHEKLHYRRLFSVKFWVLFLFVWALHLAWNTMLDIFPYLTHNLQLAIATIFFVFLIVWAGMKQVEQFKKQGFIPVY